MRHSSVARNYSHMTIAQIAAAVISLCIYPLVIRRVGADSYGWYVFGTSLVNYFASFVSFGIRFPAVKAIVETIDDRDTTNRTITTIYATKGILTLIATIAFLVIIVAVTPLREHSALMIVLWALVINEMLLPQWFFQGWQKMQYISYVAVICRLVSIIPIAIWVKDSGDVLLFAIMSMGFALLAALISTAVMFAKYGVRLVKINSSDIKQLLKDAFPFFTTDIIAVLKSETATMLIGALLGMRDVAIYDLANKIVTIPRMMITNINHALFPDVVGNPNRDVKRIIRQEYIIGLISMAAVIVFAYPLALILGGRDMMAAIPVVAIVSVTLVTWLVVGAYIAFVFVPNNKYYQVTINQAIALISFLAIGIPAVLIWRNVYAISIAITLSGVAELIHCTIVTRKKKLL